MKWVLNLQENYKNEDGEYLFYVDAGKVIIGQFPLSRKSLRKQGYIF